MNGNYDAYLSSPILCGNIEEAVYRNQKLMDYSSNPFIEALPDILSPLEAIEHIRHHPVFSDEERNLPSHLRIHCVERISDLIEPVNKHVETEQFISRIIRHGYINRNPLSSDYTRFLNICSDAIKNKDLSSVKFLGQLKSTACGQVILGMSGIGKSTVIESVLMLYPQVIIHHNYKDRYLFVKQVVWLKLECPYDGGIKGLCLKFFKAMDNLLGTNYYAKFGKGKNTEEMLPEMSAVATLHGLGVLVIDEIQNLDQAKSGGEKKMLNFFVELINTFSLPIILIGTFKAKFLFDSAFRDARRASGQLNPIWINMSNDEEWESFINALWKFQWTKKYSPLTTKLATVLYNESQGIIDIAVKLFKLAQWRAITTDMELIDAKMILSVSFDYLKLVRPMLNAIKSGKDKEIKNFEDIDIPKELMDFAKNQSINNLSNNDKKTKAVAHQNRLSKSPEKLVLISNISSWLIQAGVTPEKSTNYAIQVLDNYGTNTDISILLREAFLIASTDPFKDSNCNSPNIYEPEINQRNNDEALSDTNLPNLLKQADRENVSINKILNENFIIKDPSEFL